MAFVAFASRSVYNNILKAYILKAKRFADSAFQAQKYYGKSG